MVGPSPFSTDGSSSSAREALFARLVALTDLPVALAGIATHHVQNAMAATAAALGIGLPEEAIVTGLRTFVQGTHDEPGTGQRVHTRRTGGRCRLRA